MPYKEKEIEKIYYTIGEIADMFQVNTSHIRFWSKEFDIIKPSTNRKGNRMFTQSDIDNFRKIYHLVKEKGFTLKGAKHELKTGGKGTPAEDESPVVNEPQMQGELNLFDQPSVEIKPSNENGFNFVDKIAVLNALRKMRVSLLEVQDQLTQLETN